MVENEVVEDGQVFYPGIIDQKTLSACLGTADQIMRGHTEPETAERYRRTKANLTAQMRAHPLSFDEWNARAASPTPDTTGVARSVDAEVTRILDGIYEHLLLSGVPEDRIDGAGCDSGDPLDFINAEITQAINYFQEDTAVPETEWRSLESAPRGRKILVAYRNPQKKWRRVCARYYEAGTLEGEFTERAEAGWFEECEGQETIFPVEYEPELWHELPPLPTSEERI